MHDMTSRPYNGENDLKRLKSFVSSVMGEDMQLSYWHVGDLLWGIYKDSIYDPRLNVRFWEDENSDLLGFGWINSNEVVLQVSPHIRESDVNDLLEQMIIWGEEHQYRSLADGNFPSFCA
jgi:hypothetical protein